MKFCHLLKKDSDVIKWMVQQTKQPQQRMKYRSHLQHYTLRCPISKTVKKNTWHSLVKLKWESHTQQLEDNTPRFVHHNEAAIKKMHSHKPNQQQDYSNIWRKCTNHKKKKVFCTIFCFELKRILTLPKI